jgi:hypothetical protein
MRIRNSLAFALLLLAPACQSEHPASDGPVATSRDRLKTEVQLHATTRVTADGEKSPALVPAAPAPALEVGEGEACGVFDASGALRRCQDGTFCLSEGPGSTGACKKAPRARPSDG